MSKLIGILKQADIFYQVTPVQMEMIAGLCEERTYKQGEQILAEGASSKDLYVILQGEVDILVNPALVGDRSSVRGEVTIATLRRGQCFGEVALVDEGVRSASVRAASKETRLVLIPRDKLLMLCETYPMLGYQLMFNLAADLAMKIRNTDMRIRETLLYSRQKK